MFTLNSKGKLISLQTPLVAGIINASPDSFYSAGRDQSPDAISALAKKMISEGAAMLDIGAQSTRPGSERISAEKELSRVLPVIEMIKAQLPEIIISVDTYQSEVALAAVHAGASIVNDISGGEADPEMLSAVASMRVPYICMHMKGEPKHMQLHANYENITKEVLDYFIKKIAACKSAGINDIIIDPGLGFAKTPAHNFILLKNFAVFKMLDAPVLTGLSRKSTVYKTLGITADEALNGTTVLNTLALNNGANILRVHDVKEAAEAVKLWQAYNNS